MLRFVATFRSADYQRRMPAMRLMRFLTILAVLLAPLGMIGGASAQAAVHPVPAATVHHAMAGMDCAGMAESEGKSDRQQPQPHDCMMACAAIPAEGMRVEHEAQPPETLPHPSLAAVPHGLHPEAATPPPRRA